MDNGCNQAHKMSIPHRASSKLLTDLPKISFLYALDKPAVSDSRTAGFLFDQTGSPRCRGSFSRPCRNKALMKIGSYA